MALDPRIPEEAKRAGITSHSKAIIEAVRPFHLKESYPPTSALTQDEASEIEMKWGSIIGVPARRASRRQPSPAGKRRRT